MTACTILIVSLAAIFLIDAAASAELTHGGLRVLQQQPEGKIVGPAYENITEGVLYNAFVQVITGTREEYSGITWCTGTLIAPQAVLTAAHCCYSTSSVTIDVTLSAHRLTRYAYQPGAGIGAKGAVVTRGINYDIDDEYIETFEDGRYMDSKDLCIINLKQPAAGPILIEPVPVGEILRQVL